MTRKKSSVRRRVLRAQKRWKTMISKDSFYLRLDSIFTLKFWEFYDRLRLFHLHFYFWDDFISHSRTFIDCLESRFMIDLIFIRRVLHLQFFLVTCVCSSIHCNSQLRNNQSWIIFTLWKLVLVDALESWSCWSHHIHETSCRSSLSIFLITQLSTES